MASPTARLSFRLVLGLLLVLALFYVGRPLYWKISATIHDIQQNKQTVRGGISEIVLEAQKTVGWFHDESDSGVRDNRATARKILRQVLPCKSGSSCMDCYSDVIRPSIYAYMSKFGQQPRRSIVVGLSLICSVAIALITRLVESRLH